MTRYFFIFQDLVVKPEDNWTNLLTNNLIKTPFYIKLNIFNLSRTGQEKVLILNVFFFSIQWIIFYDVKKLLFFPKNSINDVIFLRKNKALEFLLVSTVHPQIKRDLSFKLYFQFPRNFNSRRYDWRRYCIDCIHNIRLIFKNDDDNHDDALHAWWWIP